MKRKPLQSSILRILARKKAISRTNLVQEADQSISDPYAITRSVKNLVDAGLAEVISSGHDEYLRITPTGKHKLNSLDLSSGTIPVPATWDGLWRIIILDLPEERKSEREALRYLLKKAGFACVKNTVWVSPYPFEHFFMNIKKDLGLSTELMILTTEFLDPETTTAFNKTFRK